jgi:putative DNA methylase
VALPLDAINAESARSKRKAPAGYPTTVHCWFAQRPVAAARAILFAQLVNDPSWKYSPEDLKKPQIRSAITRRRNELFKLIGELVLWENVLNESVLERARAEIRVSWKETCEANREHPEAALMFDPSRIPSLADPFAGGASIPLEAQRLGLHAHATDLNPVAVLINKALVDIPPRFSNRAPIAPISKSEKQTRAKATETWSAANGLAEDVRRYGQWMRDEGHRRIGHLYPAANVSREITKSRPDLKSYEGRALPVIAHLWARTVTSPNPAAKGAEIPLVSTFLLSASVNRQAWAELVLDNIDFSFAVRQAPLSASEVKELSIGTRLGKAQDFRCPFTRTTVTREYVRTEAKAGRLGTRLMAIVAEGDKGRVYLPANALPPIAFSPDERAIIGDARRTFLAGPTPTRAMITGGVCSAYGLESWGSLFTDRQVLALTTFADLVADARKDAVERAVATGMSLGTSLEGGGTGAQAYGDAIAVYLAFAVDRLADYGSTIATWRPKDNAMRSTLSKQGLPMTWDFAEGSPFGSSSAGMTEAARVVARVLEFLPASATATVAQADAQTAVSESLQFFSTDPPYYDNISYAEISDFFYAWLRRSLRPVIPGLFETLAVPKAEELVAIPFRHGGKKEADEFFLGGMTLALGRIARGAHPSAPITVYYAFKQSETQDESTSSTGWETFLEAVLRAGLTVTGTWPVRTESDNRQVGNQANALASSIVLVCRPNMLDARTVARKDFLRQLERALPPALAEMTADPLSAIAPVDLAQAAIGPGMAIFSQYSAVLEADGASMSVHNALVHINKAIDNFFSEAEGEMDADTRFCISWFQQYGFEVGPFGEADVLARAKGTAVDGVKEGGVLSAAKSKVRLLRVGEYPKNWDPTTDARVPVWEACHQMSRALSESEHDAGALLARMPEKQDAIRALAYRLYTICERQKWAEDARAYNELVTSWPAIVEESVKAGLKGEQLSLV